MPAELGRSAATERVGLNAQVGFQVACPNKRTLRYRQMVEALRALGAIEGILDIKGRSHYGLPILSGFSFVRAQPEFLPKYGAVSARILQDGVVVAEVVDDGVRFMDGRRDNEVRRGQTLWLWTTLSAANYRYVLRYGFVDDGTIQVRIGGTAENLYDDSEPPGNKPVHVHMAAWRMEFDLGAAGENMISMVERKPVAGGGATMVHRPFNNNVEGGEKWVAEHFTALKVMNMTTFNRHVPPRHVAYKLMPLRAGTLRTEQRFTEHDFWVTRRSPMRDKRRFRAPELAFVDVPDNVAQPEPIEHQPTVIWYTAGANHMPRTEDFGQNGFRRRDGVAIAMWAGFDLMPHDVWDKTPFLRR